MTRLVDGRAGVAASLLGTALEGLVHSSAVVALAAAGLTVTTASLADLPLRAGPPVIVFGATLFVYSADRVFDRASDARTLPSRAAFTRRYGRYTLAVGALLYAATATGAVLLDRPGVAALGLPLAASFAYTVLGVKRVYLLKNLFVGVAWGAIPLGVAGYVGALGDPAVWVLAGYVTCMLSLAAMVFDLKDVEADAAAGVETVPTRHGPATTRRVAQLGNGCVAAAVVALVVAGVVPPAFLVLLVQNCYVAAYVVVATPDRGPLFYGFVVDGEHVFLAAVVTGLDVLTAAPGW